MISLLVPTFNEEELLPALLESRELLDMIGETIVADHKSKDQTIDIANTAGCEVIEGGFPAKGKNRAAKTAIYPLLLFADADTILIRSCIDAAVAAVGEGAVAVHFRYSPSSISIIGSALYYIMHLLTLTFQAAGFRLGIGAVLLVRADAFWTVGGFDESLLAGEDVDILKRLSEIGPVCYYSRESIPTSPRRFRMESALVYILKCLLWFVFPDLRRHCSPVKYIWPHST